MSEIEVNATRLPGVGWRYELALARGTALFVLVEDSGRRHLLLVRDGDDEPMVTVPLNEAQAPRRRVTPGRPRPPARSQGSPTRV